MDESTNRLIFKLGDLRYAVNLGDVLGIVDAERFYHIPGQSDPVEGMISRRGEVIAVANIKKVLAVEDDVATHGGDKKNKVVIVKKDEKTLGLLIGDSEVIFKWEGSAQKDDGSPAEDEPFEFLDWSPIYEEVTSTLTLKEDDENTAG